VAQALRDRWRKEKDERQQNMYNAVHGGGGSGGGGGGVEEGAVVVKQESKGGRGVEEDDDDDDFFNRKHDGSSNEEEEEKEEREEKEEKEAMEEKEEKEEKEDKEEKEEKEEKEAMEDAVQPFSNSASAPKQRWRRKHSRRAIHSRRKHGSGGKSGSSTLQAFAFGTGGGSSFVGGYSEPPTTTGAGYQPYTVPSGTGDRGDAGWSYQSTSYMPQFQWQSHEELRIADMNRVACQTSDVGDLSDDDDL